MPDGGFLVTGPTGFLGQYVVRELTQKRERVIALFRRIVPRMDDVTAIEGDLLQSDFHLANAQFQVVIHVAGLAHTVPITTEDRRRFFAVNVEGTRNLINAIEKGGKLPESFVLVSTVAVYGCEEGFGIDESAPRDAGDPYGASKRQAEDIVLDWGAQRDVRIGIVRLPLVVGRNAPGNLGRMIRAIKKRRYCAIGDGEANRSMVLAREVAAVLPDIARAGGIFHLTDGHHPSFAELESGLARVLAVPPPPRLPLLLARSAAVTGDVLQRLFHLNMPLSSRTYHKMTSTLTFSDRRARAELGWRSSPVLDHLSELV